MKALLLAPALALPLAGCGLAFDREVSYQQVAPERFPVLQAVGSAVIAKQAGDSERERQLNAMQAAKLVAYRELAEQLHGLRLASSGALQHGRLHDDGMEVTWQGRVQGARVVRSYALDGVYVTELELDTRRLFDLQQSLKPRQEIRQVRYY
ncbi:hypothetical protein [Gallaecimonas sp. GXIMD4217]|uniref:LPP20 family lipoprotein n=1 Tax=Gallaecimonas sp. GXIMD4217 TaxID=3131927 RepID=UPI00311B1EFD